MNDLEDGNISKIVSKLELLEQNEQENQSQLISNGQFLKKSRHQKISSLILHEKNQRAWHEYYSARQSTTSQPEENLEEQKKEIMQTPENCLVCFSEPPNAVIMECGHGGICCTCALDLWKKTNECFLCRNKITSYLEIDLEQSQEDYIKVISETILNSQQIK